MPPASGERSRETGGYRHAPLAEEWRALRRAATVVALLTSPAFFLLLWQRNGWALPWALLGTFVAVVGFRGLVDVITRRLIPWPNLYNANPELLEEDVIARRRAWYWRKKFRRLTIFGTIFVIVVGTVALISGDELRRRDLGDLGRDPRARRRCSWSSASSCRSSSSSTS